MPRRKVQGISPTKRTAIANRDGGNQTRKKPADNNEDPGGGPSGVQLPEMEPNKDNAEESSEVNNSKYLHKKFKKIASASIPPPSKPSEVILNGLKKSQEEVANCATPETFDLSSASGKSNSNAPKSNKVIGCAVSSPGPGALGRYVCPYCKLACAKPSVLQKHIRAHTNERPYPCDPCGFAFKTKSNLYKHCRSRAHALKMEEHGAKFTFPLEESSDIEDEEDENNSNNTPPPPVPPNAFAGLNHISVTPSVVIGASLPTMAQSLSEKPEKRTIYKPKFHKAAMYHEEEDALLQTAKKGSNLCLKIPAPNVPSFSSVGSVLSKTPSSPSSEFLQRHISKIISENQAIVETTDLRPKKHSRQKDKDGSPASPLSASTSPGLDHSRTYKTTYRQLSLSESSEDRMKAHHAAQSKLALALLRPNLPTSPRRQEGPPTVTSDLSASYNQPLNLTTNHVKDADVGFLLRKRSISEGFGNCQKQGTVLKEQNTLNRTLNFKGRIDESVPDGLQKNVDKFFHPQNPEGSIIKDLLLKASAASAAGLSIQGFHEMVDGEFAATSLPQFPSLEDYQGSQNAQYICQLCKIPYRNAENLEIHQLYYCKGDGSKQLPSPQRSPNPKYGSTNRESQELKLQPLKGKQKLDLKISPIREGSKICQPYPSPGPLLGNTPLVESYFYNKKDDDDFGRQPKKQRLDSETSSRSSPNSLHEVRSISSPFAAMSTGGTTTLRSLEELSKCPMRPNSLQMFGGEVSILDGAGETKTMRIEPRGKSPAASEYLSLPNVHQGGMISKPDNIDTPGNSSPHIVVTIARSGLNSGGTLVQVPLKANAASNLVKPPRSSGGSVNSRNAVSPISLSPLHRTPRHSVGSPPHTPFSSATYFSQQTPTLTNSFPDTPKLMPNITTPNLAPNMSHHLQFMPFTSILPDGTLLNPLTSITAYNPLTLPPHSGILHTNLLNLSAKDHSKSGNEGSYVGGVIPIIHGGKVIPYVQGMPGPQTLLSTSPHLGTRKPTVSPRPLDLASPLKEQLPSFKSDVSQNINQQPMNFSKTKLHKSSNYTTSTVIQSSHRKASVKDVPSSMQRNLTSKLTAVPVSALTQVQKLQISIPSIKVDSGSPVSESGVEETYRPIQTSRKSLKKLETVLYLGAKESAKDNEEDISQPMEIEVEDSVSVETHPKFLRPTSLPLKPGTFVPKQHRGSGLTPTGSTVLSLVSPETPRPKKSYGQLYLNGHSYTYLALKCSTRPFYCTLNRPQPMYVPLSPEHSKLSMYSNWKVCSEADPNPLGLDPGKAMAFYDSRHRAVTFTVAQPSDKLPMSLTHSSYWVNKALAVPPVKSVNTMYGDREERLQSDQRDVAVDGIENLSLGESTPKRVKIFDGGFESNEEYIYVRGRGRGRYICEACGIRCKKPSMLRKHIRTHTDVRPFTCKHCNFSFKTKGNLTKHMKSKAHYKKCVELGIVPVPTIVDDSYIDEECLARQQALRASRHGNGDTDSDDNEEEEDEDEDEDDDDELADDEGKLEREAACSLLSLSESTHFSTNHRYLSLGLIPLPSIIARPTSYPYTLTFAMPKPNQQVTEPQTPTLTNLTAQTEREKVTRNTGLAFEYREDPIGKVINVLNQRNSSGLVPPTGEKNRCYFPSRRTPTLVKSVSEKSWSDEESDGFDDENSEGLTDESEMSDVEERNKSDKNHFKANSKVDKDSVKSEDYEEKNFTKTLRESVPEGRMRFLRELRESYEQSVGIKLKEEPANAEFSDQNSTAPMDLSNKTMSLTRKLSITLPYYVGSSNGARTPTTPMSDILTPVPEPAVLASLCSSMERFPVPQTLPAKLPTDIKETTMLQAYLTEKALQDVRIKQHQRRHNQGYTVVTQQCLSKTKEVWSRPVPKAKEEVMRYSPELIIDSKKSQTNLKSSDNLLSILHTSTNVPISNAETIKIVEVTEKDTKINEISKELLKQETSSYPSPRNVELVIVSQSRDISNHLKESDVNTDLVEDSNTNKARDAPNTETKIDKVQNSVETIKSTDGFKLQSNESMSEKLACVSMANNMARNVVVGGVGFSGHQPSSPNPSSGKKSPVLSGKPKAEFLPPSIGPTSSYCSVMEDGRSVCVICNKIFSKPSQLRLHVNIHYFERPFRCESCAVSFRTKGHLQKHERSVSHQNKVSMNSTFGTATTTNPRPFKCDDCKIAFRIHGHLAKHLRSKMHIMKLECVGKLPFGTYAEMEREGVSLNDIDTSDCDNSLESLQILAQKLYEKDPSKLGQWDGERGELLNPNPQLSGGESSSDEGEPCISPPNLIRHIGNIAQEELNFKNLSLKNNLKLEHTSSPPLHLEYAANSRMINYSDGQHKRRLPYQSLVMLAPKEHTFNNEANVEIDVRRNLESDQLDSLEQSTNPNTLYKKSSQSVEPSRKRKSVDELDYTDTSDGDNEATSNLKYSCGVCLQEFNTIASLHVHSFVEHDTSTEDDKTTSTVAAKLLSPNVAPCFLTALQKGDSTREDDASNSIAVVSMANEAAGRLQVQLTSSTNKKFGMESKSESSMAENSSSVDTECKEKPLQKLVSVDLKQNSVRDAKPEKSLINNETLS